MISEFNREYNLYKEQTWVGPQQNQDQLDTKELHLLLDDLEKDPPPLPTEEEYSSRMNENIISDFPEKTLYDMSLEGRLFALMLHANINLANGSSTYFCILVDSGESASYVEAAPHR